MAGASVLVFCPTKNWCEKIADTVARAFFGIGKPPGSQQEMHMEGERTREARGKLQGQLNGQKLSEVIEQLKRCPAGLDKTLAKTISFAVSYHHAGK